MDQNANSIQERIDRVMDSPGQEAQGTILSLLLENLSDPNPRVRTLAIREISDCTEKAVIDQLIDLAQHDPDLGVRCTAISGLGDLVCADGIVAYDPETDKDLSVVDGELSKPDIEQIYRFLLSVCRDERCTLDEKRHAVEAQSVFSNETVEELIADLYARPEKSARKSALFAMGINGAMRWVDILREELYNPDRDLQLDAIRAAGEMCVDVLGKGLWRLTYSDDREVMLSALWSLGQTGWDGAFDRLDELTLHEEFEIREVADEAMSEWLFYNGLESESDEEENDWLFGDE